MRGTWDSARRAKQAEQKQQAELRAKAWADTKRNATWITAAGIFGLASISVIALQVRRRYPFQVDLARPQLKS
jgi:hypothetical protein